MARSAGCQSVAGLKTCRAGAALVLVLGLALGPESAVAQPRNAARLEPPKWLDDDGKELFNDLEGDENLFGDTACEAREKLLKHLAGQGSREAAEYRARTLLGLGLCEFRKGDYERSKKRLNSAVSELNLPSEELLLTNPNLAPIGTMRQAAEFMAKQELTQAGTALRRCHEIMDRNLKKVLKAVHKQLASQTPGLPLEKLLEELPGYGRSGQFLPLIKDQVPALKQDLLWSELIEQSLDTLDKRLAAFDPSQKQKRDKLDVGKAKSKGGSLLYVRVLATEPIAPAQRLSAAQELVKAGLPAALAEEAAAIEKAQTLLKRTKEGPACKEDAGLAKTCKALQKVPDIASNVFGETRLLAVRVGKKQQVETCSTNANVGILVAAKDGARVSVAGAEGPVALNAGEPVVFDLCREATLEADGLTHVLFSQAWHPEFAAVERTAELRSKGQAFGLSEEEVKAATKVVNDNAKSKWEKAAELWRRDSAALEKLRQSLRQEIEDRQRQQEEAAQAKRSQEVASDDERKRALEELEKKREAKRKAQEKAEEARKLRKKQLEEERAKRDPWLNSPEVLELEKRIEEMKESRRDANAKLEFDMSTKLTKEISLAERQLKKAIKQAKKAHRSGGKAAASTAAAKDAAEETPESTVQEKKGAKAQAKGAQDSKAKASPELEKLRKKLEEVRKAKATASEAEDFKEAKRLKQEQKELEEKIKKLEL